MAAGDSAVTREEFRDLRGEVVGLRSDFQSLQRIVERLAEEMVRLAEGQRKLFEGQSRLFEGQRRLEESVMALVEAQRHTDEAVRGLAIQVGALGENIGFGLEDVARVMLPPWLEKHMGVALPGLERRFFMVDDRRVEVNLYGEGVRGGRRAIVLGEARSRIYERDVKEFHSVSSFLVPTLGDEVLRVMFGFFIHPVAQEEAERLGIVLVASYMR